MPATPPILRWRPPTRLLLFALSASSIWCLLAEMYHLVDMRTFFYAVLLPATAALYTLALYDRRRGPGLIFRAVTIGTLGGLAGAAAYDLFRLPFVFADAWGLAALGVPQMPLFKVFPRFGALILAQPLEQPAYSLPAHLLGWAYHFSNGATFGVMFAAAYLSAKTALAPAPRSTGKTIAWATLMAAGIEACLLLSPYASFFSIRTTATFVAVTLTAHLVFGLGLGAWFAWHASRWRLAGAAPGCHG
jgi:hypothetical protein